MIEKLIFLFMQIQSYQYILDLYIYILNSSNKYNQLIINLVKLNLNFQ